MKNWCLFLLMYVFFTPINTNSQVLNRIEKRVEQKVNQRVNRKTDKAIDKGLDKVEEVYKKKNTPKQTNPSNSTDSKKQTSTSNDLIQYQSKFDFVPGDKVLFYDDFEPDAMGDFPVKWNTNGSGEIVNINKQVGKWLRIPDNTVSFPELKGVLPLNFTIEFDLLYPISGQRPPVTFGFSEVSNPNKTAFTHKSIFYFLIPSSIKQAVGYSESLYSGKDVMLEWPVDKMVDQNIHVSIAVNGTRIRLYLNDQKLIDLPKGFEKTINRNNFHFRAASVIPKAKDAFYISNIRIAETGKDARSSLLKEGRFSTTGIYFNTGSAEIKPNSHAVLKEIAEAFKENTSLKVKIVGHTDNIGTPVSNQKLSEDRAESVKNYLIKHFNIEINRLITEGKGDTSPSSPNTTLEGKAQNRRVEFLKID